MASIKLQFNNKPKIDFAEVKFAHSIVLYFFRTRSRLYPNLVVNESDKWKNKNLAKIFYRNVVNRKLDIDVSLIEDIEEFYKNLDNADFWKDKIDFMFKYADSSTLQYYSQTINGVFKFYFKHYDRLKEVVKSPTISAEDKLILSLVRKWNRNDVIDCFYFYVIKVYKYVYSDADFKYKQDYYRFVKYFSNLSSFPKIHPIVLENNQLLRGLLIQFKGRLQEWGSIVERDLLEELKYKEIEDLSEIKGAEFYQEITDKSLNEIIDEAATRFIL